MKLTEAKLKELILEAMDDDWGQSMSPAEKIANGMEGGPENIENMLFMADSLGADLSEIGQYLSDDTAWYILSQSKSTHPEWAQMLITSKNPRILIWLLRDWKLNREMLTDDQLIKLYKSGPESFRQKMSKYKSLPPAVRSAMGIDDEEKQQTTKRRSSLIQRRLKRRK